MALSNAVVLEYTGETTCRVVMRTSAFEYTEIRDYIPLFRMSVTYEVEGVELSEGSEGPFEGFFRINFRIFKNTEIKPGCSLDITWP